MARDKDGMASTEWIVKNSVISPFPNLAFYSGGCLLFENKEITGLDLNVSKSTLVGLKSRLKEICYELNCVLFQKRQLIF